MIDLTFSSTDIGIPPAVLGGQNAGWVLAQITNARANANRGARVHGFLFSSLFPLPSHLIPQVEEAYDEGRGKREERREETPRL
jgi:hypothetical protein